MSGNGAPGNGGAKGRAAGKDSLGPQPVRRFYASATSAAHGGGFAVLLDGKPIRTPAKRAFVLPASALAEAVAAEWAAQGDRVDPATMPLTRIANSAIDAVADRAGAVADDIAAFAASDLICYRAASPEALVARQRAFWDPVVAWARETLDAELTVTSGIVHVAQSPTALRHIRRALDGLDPFRLTSLHVMTVLTGSAALALAVLRGRLTSKEAWRAAHVDEDWQIEQWGRDAEADARRSARLAEFMAADRAQRLLVNNL